jgi:hypothetical protein
MLHLVLAEVVSIGEEVRWFGLIVRQGTQRCKPAATGANGVGTSAAAE